MRKAAMFAAVLMCAVAARAADPGSGATQLSVFTSNLSLMESSATGARYFGGVGLALSHAWTPRWSAELSVAAQRHRGAYTLLQPYDDAGHLVPVTEFREFSVFPVDLTTQYRFTNSTRWTPYLNAGFRYVRSPAHSNNSRNAITPSGFVPVQEGFAFGADRNSLEIGLGTMLRLTPHFGLRLDGMRLLRSDNVHYDPQTRGSVGLSWKF